MRIVLFLTCLAVLARTGPVPACQLDELIGNCFAASGDDAREATAPTDPARPMLTLPLGNDTPDDVASDTAVHQSFGSVHPPAPVLQDAGAGPLPCNLLPPPQLANLPHPSAPALPARALYPPSPPTLKHRPLLL